MITHVTYHAGRPREVLDVGNIIDAIADQILDHGDVERAMQSAFRLGTDDDFGMLDILDRLRDEIERESSDGDLTDMDQADSSSPSKDDAQAMRDALREVQSPEDLQGLDPKLMERALTLEERVWVDKWSDATGQLIDSGLVARQGGKLQLTPRALRRIGANLLRHVYLPPVRRGQGGHPYPVRGIIGAAGDEVSPWEWGQPFDVDIAATLMNSVRRSSIQGRLVVRPGDFAVRDRESASSYTSVLLLDMSRSMFDSGAWDVAKRAAIALDALSHAQHRFDQVHLVGFSGTARELAVVDLPGLSWDQFSHGTNLHHGLIRAGRLLDRDLTRNRQIVIITDGDPTAYMDGPNAVFENPVTEKTLHATLREGARLTRAGVSTTLIRVGEDEKLTGFPIDFARTSKGRLISLPLDRLGSFVVRDVGSRAMRVFG